MSEKRFVLLDRDGTIIVERHYLSSASGVELLPGAAEGLRKLMDLDLGLIMVTNQSGLARGYFTSEALGDIHAELHRQLQREGVVLNGIYYCGHTDADGCPCRKPMPGLAQQAADEFTFDLASAFVIGDKPCDIDLGRNCGAKSVLVRTGYGSRYGTDETQPDWIAENLSHAADILTVELKKGLSHC